MVGVNFGRVLGKTSFKKETLEIEQTDSYIFEKKSSPIETIGRQLINLKKMKPQSKWSLCNNSIESINIKYYMSFFLGIFHSAVSNIFDILLWLDI